MHSTPWILPALLALALPAQATSFRLTDLAAPAGQSPTYSHGSDLNARGDVVGHAGSASFPVATTWLAAGSPTGTAQRVGEASTMPGARSAISAVNAAGLMAGNHAGASGSVAMFNSGSGWQQAPWPDPRYSCCGQVDDISDAGVAVGSWYPVGISGATRWTHTAQGGWVADSLGGGQGNALAVNEQGQIAGNTVALGAVLWQADKTLVDIGAGDGRLAPAVAAQLNDAGSVVGWGSNASQRRQGFVWAEGVMTVLPGLAGWQQAPDSATWISNARDINNQGWVVGQALAADGSQHGFLWQGGAMLDLNSLVAANDPFFSLPELPADASFRIVDATAVNDAGQILVVARFNRLAANGALQQAEHSLLLSPVAAVPEPAGWAMLLAGGAGLLAWRRRSAAALG